MQRLIEEIRKRNILRAVGAYAVGVWLVLQVASVVSDPWGVPPWVMQLLIVVAIIGFPVTVAISWFYEWTPEGLMTSDGADAAGYLEAKSFGRLFDYVVIALMAIAIAFLVLEVSRREPVLLAENPQSIAVLPFVNLSSDPEQEYFSDGVAEEILNVLAKVPDLHVTSRSSAFQFKGEGIHIPDAARRLGVANILEGSVRKSGNNIRITAQLIDAANDRHLWSETYDRELTDIFIIQEEISNSIVEALYVHLGVAPPVVPKVQEINVEAYRLYLLGRHKFEQRSQETLQEAIDLFDQAIAIDPNYAPAYAGRADALTLLLGTLGIPRSERLARARPFIDKALALDPGLAEAHTSLGLSLYLSNQIEESIRAYDRALHFNPNLARAWYWKSNSLAQSGDDVAAREHRQRAYALDPLSVLYLLPVINEKLRAGQFAEADTLMDGIRTADPRDLVGRVNVVYIETDLGNLASAYTLASEIYNVEPGMWPAYYFGFAQMALKAFDPMTPGFTQATRFKVNAFGDPAVAWQEFETLPAEERNPSTDYIFAVIAAVGDAQYRQALEIWENQPGASDLFPGPLFNTTAPKQTLAPILILARQKTGDASGAKRLLEQFETFIAHLKGQGMPLMLDLLDANVHVLKGESDAAVAALERQLEASQQSQNAHILWFELEAPVFDDLRNREDFQSIVRSVNEHINTERAKLGWEPLD